MLGDHFDLADLGAYELKGFAEPAPAWRVLSARDVESRFAATRAGSAAPLVGRQEEMGLLLRAWDGSRQGRGQVVLIQGEAGVGKSQIAGDVAREHVADRFRRLGFNVLQLRDRDPKIRVVFAGQNDRSRVDTSLMIVYSMPSR